jgi:hypothetical protein
MYALFFQLCCIDRAQTRRKRNLTGSPSTQALAGVPRLLIILLTCYVAISGSRTASRSIAESSQVCTICRHCHSNEALKASKRLHAAQCIALLRAAYVPCKSACDKNHPRPMTLRGGSDNIDAEEHAPHSTSESHGQRSDEYGSKPDDFTEDSARGGLLLPSADDEDGDGYVSWTPQLRRASKRPLVEVLGPVEDHRNGTTLQPGRVTVDGDGHHREAEAPFVTTEHSVRGDDVLLRRSAGHFTGPVGLINGTRPNFELIPQR